MGLTGLETFIKQKAPQCYVKISLVSLSQDLLQTNPSKDGKVNVLIDGPSFIYFAYYNVGKLGISCDTEWIGLRSAISYSLEQLRNCDFNLIFFFKGEHPKPVADSAADMFKVKSNMERRRKYVLKTLQTLRENVSKPAENIPQTQYPLNVSCYEEVLLKDLNCQVVTGRGHRNDMALYAKDATNEIAAVFSESSDFFVYDLPCVCLRLKTVDFEQTTVMKFDRQALLTRLKLHSEALPILAALMDVRFRDVNDPLRQLLQDHGLIMPCFPFLDFEKVARFAGQLQRNPRKLQAAAERLAENYLYTVLKRYSLKVTEDEPEANMVTVQSKWDEVLEFAKMKMGESQVFSDIYSLLQRCQFIGRFGLEDYEETLLPITDEILKLVRRRLYGFVFREKPPLPNGTELQIDEYCFGYDQRGAFLIFERVPPVPLPGEHPPLSVLWKIPANESNQDWQQRWGVLLAILVPDIWREESKLSRILAVLRDLGGQFIIVAITVLFLQRGTEEPILSEAEIDAFLSQAVLLSRELTANPQLNDFKYGLMSMRTLHLASLFGSVASYVGFLVAIVGYPIPWEETMPWKYYDGKVFAYSLARGTSSVNDIQSKRILAQMKSVIQIGLENEP